jgi:immunity protein 7 of polymorphic toxin system
LFEYHGWLVIQAAPHETPTEDADVRAAVEFVRQLLTTLGEAPGLRDLRWVNGRAQVHFGGYANHRPGEFEDLLTGLHGLVAQATGTYGLLHYRDDEASGRQNEFRVLVARRGTITEHDDPYLSPVIPVIEDEWVVDDA